MLGKYKDFVLGQCGRCGDRILVDPADLLDDATHLCLECQDTTMILLDMIRKCYRTHPVRRFLFFFKRRDKVCSHCYELQHEFLLGRSRRLSLRARWILVRERVELK